MQITTEQLIIAIKHLFTNAYMHILFWLIVVDVASGVLKAFKTKKYNSSVGINGLLRHMLVLFALGIAYTYAEILGVEKVFSGIVIFFIANYGISIIENWDELGLPLPSWLKVYFEKIIKSENEKGAVDAGKTK